MTKPVKLTDEAYSIGKSAMLPGESWSNLIIRMAAALRTNNNAAQPVIDEEAITYMPNGFPVTDSDGYLLNSAGGIILIMNRKKAYVLVEQLKSQFRRRFQVVEPYEGPGFMLQYYMSDEEKDEWLRSAQTVTA